MKIKWNTVTWYSKILAIIVFVATLFLGFKIGALYQEAKDQLRWSAVVSPIFFVATSTTRVLESVATGTTHVSSPTYHGMLICVNNSDCPSGSSCLQSGPIIEGQTSSRACIPNGKVIPF